MKGHDFSRAESGAAIKLGLYGGLGNDVAEERSQSRRDQPGGPQRHVFVVGVGSTGSGDLGQRPNGHTISSTALAPEGDMRLFVAVPLPDSTRAALAKWAKQCGAQPGLRWTPPEQLHITLQFLGEVANDRVSRVAEALDGIAIPAFTVFLERLEVLGRAGVLAVAARPASLLTSLAAEVRSRLASFVENPEEREFRAHVTVARARRGASVPKLHSFPPLPTLELTANCFRLYRSELMREGAVHTVVREWPLRQSTAQP